MMDAPTATIIAACIGAAASIVGTVVTVRAKSNSAQLVAPPLRETAQAAAQADPQRSELQSGFFSALLMAVIILLLVVSAFFVVLAIVIATGASSHVDGEPGAALALAFAFAFAAQYLNLRRKKLGWGTRISS
jgi:hypothetical protein